MDKYASSLYPDDGLENMTAVKVYGDGNCLPRCGSLLLFGNEDAHVEIRVRTQVELLHHEDFYLEERNLRKGMTEQVKGNLPAIYVSYMESYMQEALTDQVVQNYYWYGAHSVI